MHDECKKKVISEINILQFLRYCKKSILQPTFSNSSNNICKEVLQDWRNKKAKKIPILFV